jgi:hypothetical protein
MGRELGGPPADGHLPPPAYRRTLTDGRQISPRILMRLDGAGDDFIWQVTRINGQVTKATRPPASRNRKSKHFATRQSAGRQEKGCAKLRSLVNPT